MARSERFELPTLGIEIRCSIQLSYERVPRTITPSLAKTSPLPSKFSSVVDGVTGYVDEPAVINRS